MTEPKAAAKASAPTAAKAPEAEAQYVNIGTLRRETMILNRGDKESMIAEGKLAVRQGRAAEVFTLRCVAVASESEINWDASKIDSPVHAKRAADMPAGITADGDETVSSEATATPTGTTPKEEIAKQEAADAKDQTVDNADRKDIPPV